MSKERELFKRAITALIDTRVTDISTKHQSLIDEIEEFLAQTEQTEQESVAWLYDWEDFDGDEVNILYGQVTTDKNIFETPCAMNITPLIKGNSDE